MRNGYVPHIRVMRLWPCSENLSFTRFILEVLERGCHLKWMIVLIGMVYIIYG
jgi:hypothetical protein